MKRSLAKIIAILFLFSMQACDKSESDNRNILGADASIGEGDAKSEEPKLDCPLVKVGEAEDGVLTDGSEEVKGKGKGKKMLEDENATEDLETSSETAEISTNEECPLPADDNTKNDTTDNPNTQLTEQSVSIMMTNCSSCHSGANPAGGISLSNETEIKNSFTESFVAINEGTMPPGKKQLSPDEIQVLKTWSDGELK